MEKARAIATEAMAIVEARQKEEWQPVISLDAPLLPPLDINAFPKWAGDYTSALAHFTETPLELAMSMVLAACSAASARRFRVMVRQGYYEPTNLWLACALAPGNRKSSVQEAASAPLLSWERLTPYNPFILSRISLCAARSSGVISFFLKTGVFLHSGKYRSQSVAMTPVSSRGGPLATMASPAVSMSG